MKKVLGIALLVGAAAYGMGAFKKSPTTTETAPALPADPNASDWEGKVVVDQTTGNWIYITGGKAYYVSKEGWASFEQQNPGYTPPTVDAQKYYPVSGEYFANNVIKSY